MIRARLANRVQEEAQPTIEQGLAQAGFAAWNRVDSEKLHVAFDLLFEDFSFVLAEVMIEFGARSTSPKKLGLSCATRPASCPRSSFQRPCRWSCWRKEPSARKRPPLMSIAARNAGVPSASRGIGTKSRDWTIPVSQTGHSRAIRSSHRLHATRRSSFLRRLASGNRIDCQAAVSAGLQLVPIGEARTLLADDYERMLADGMPHDDDGSFERLMQRCAETQARAIGLREGDGQIL